MLGWKGSQRLGDLHCCLNTKAPVSLNHQLTIFAYGTSHSTYQLDYPREFLP